MTTEVVIEITSPSKRVLDVDNKVDLYYRCGIPRYVIVDVERERGTNQLQSIELVDYRASEAGYVAQQQDPSGTVWLETVRLGLVVEGATLRCIDEHGQTINAEFVEQFRAREQAERQAREQVVAREQAEAKARDAEERIRKLEAALRQARGES